MRNKELSGFAGIGESIDGVSVSGALTDEEEMRSAKYSMLRLGV